MKYTPVSLALLFFMVPCISYAAVSYTVAPLVIDVEGEARDILEYDITLTNNGGQPVTVYPSVNNISIEKGGTAEHYQQPVQSDRTTSLASWIEIPRSGVKLPVGETKIIPLRIRVNPNPEPGEYHARLGFGSGRNVDIAQQMVSSGRAPSTVITLTIVDKKSEYLKLSRFIVDRFVTSKDNESVTYTLNNPGDEMLAPTGEIIFYDKRGVEIAAVPVNAGLEKIQPGGEKEFKTTVPIDDMFGKYKAFLSVEYGNSQLASVQDTTFFYVFPVKMILILLGIVSVLVIIGSLYVHKRYLDDAVEDDSDYLPLHIRESRSETKEHDIDLKQQ